VKLQWVLIGDSVWRAMVGALVAEITECGAGTIGANIYVSTFAGKLAAVQGSLEACKRQTEFEAMREVLSMQRSLKGTA
jgi:hypothetical protein